MAKQNTFQGSDTLTEYEKKTKEYEKAVETALAKISASPLGTAVEDAFSRLQNRAPFSYDISGDGLYQQYKQQYTALGERAMRDTVAKGSELTGGYGNSYAQSAGQQAYGEYLNQLNNMVPELYQLAYNRYTAEGDQLEKEYELLVNRENQLYNRSQDSFSTLQELADYYAGMSQKQRTYETDLWQQALKREDDLAKFNYEQQRDQIADQQWQKEYELALEKSASEKKKTEEQKTDSENQQLISTAGEWGAGEWEAYFAKLRNKYGSDYAHGILDELVQKGNIPQSMVVFAMVGINGEMKGH